MPKKVPHSRLILVRHGETEWNAKGIWCGHTQIDLTKKGRQQAREAAESIKHIQIHQAFASTLTRTIETLTIILEHLKLAKVPRVHHHALMERHYGEFTGKNKWEIKNAIGEEQFTYIRRSWEGAPPQGESLKQVYERAIPYFKKSINPHLEKGKNTIVVSSSNALRALLVHLDKIPTHRAESIEMKTGEVIVFDFNIQGKIIDRNVLATNTAPGKQ